MNNDNGNTNGDEGTEKMGYLDGHDNNRCETLGQGEVGRCGTCDACKRYQAESDARTEAQNDPAGNLTERDVAIKEIRKALRQRSGKAWSVKGGRGTGWGWIRISAPPKRCGEWGYMTDDDRAELGGLLGLGKSAHQQGEQVMASGDARIQYVHLARGTETPIVGVPYWD